MFTAAFVKAALERAVKTFAQVLLAALVGGPTGLWDVQWTTALSAAGLAAVASVLTSIVSSGVGNAGPSLGGEQLDTSAALPR